jgi:hypothetical protein
MGHRWPLIARQKSTARPANEGLSRPCPPQCPIADCGKFTILAVYWGDAPGWSAGQRDLLIERLDGMTEQYWVVGGEYTDTDFREIADGGEPERYGPYADYAKARSTWAALSMAHIDNAHVRYAIDRRGFSQYWVIGGRYESTEFKCIADGGAEERAGPFDDYDTALKEWRARSMAHIDEANVRFRIEQV